MRLDTWLSVRHWLGGQDPPLTIIYFIKELLWASKILHSKSGHVLFQSNFPAFVWWTRRSTV